MQRALTLVASGLVLIAGQALAGSFSVAPVLVSLDGRSPIAALRVTNLDKAQLTVQSELVRWSQAEGKDAYEPTDTLIVNPPIFKLAPGATQTIRLGGSPLPRCPIECAFRLLLSEVPAPGSQGVTVALRLSVPVFVAPGVRQAAALAWSARRVPSGVRLSARNEGTVRAQILELSVDGKPVAKGEGPVYLLAGTSGSWELPRSPESRAPTLEVEVVTADGRNHASVAVADP